MNRLSVPLLLLCMATSMQAFANPGAPATPKEQSAEQRARLEMLERQKQLVDQLNLPPAQQPTDAPTMLDLPVDDSDSPGATKK